MKSLCAIHQSGAGSAWSFHVMFDTVQCYETRPYSTIIDTKVSPKIDQKLVGVLVVINYAIDFLKFHARKSHLTNSPSMIFLGFFEKKSQWGHQTLNAIQRFLQFFHKTSLRFLDN